MERMKTVSARITPTGRLVDLSLSRLREAQERVRARARGRAWINGLEVGGRDQRYAHIERVFD
jgi:hypothetical protein